MLYDSRYFVVFPYYYINVSTYNQVVNCLFSCSRLPLSVQKSRGNLSYSNRKLSKQKGTGCARHGSRSSPTMRGGGRAFPGSNLRNYNKKVNKKVMLLFIRSLLYKKFNCGNIYIYNDLLLPKSTNLLSMYIYMLFNKRKVLVINNSFTDNMSRYSKNINNIYILSVTRFSPLHLINFDFLLINRNCCNMFTCSFLI
ncbi:uL4 family ribosomal protein [Candidatus Vidania fulgoroideorum]